MSDENIDIRQKLSLGNVIVDAEVLGYLLESLFDIDKFTHRHDDLIFVRVSESLDTLVIEVKVFAEDSSDTRRKHRWAKRSRSSCQQLSFLYEDL